MKAVAKAEMLIRRPVAEVFRAFIDPAITTKFWFTKGSAKLEPGKTVKWEWEMYNVSAEATVKTIEANKRIVIEWSTYGAPTTIEWLFIPLPDNTTFVSISNTGFSGDDDQVLQQVVASTEGFTLVLAGLKALFEHGVSLNLVADRFPQGLQKQTA